MCVYICVGAPAHWTRDIKQYGGLEYCDRCLGRNRSVLWPLQSPDHLFSLLPDATCGAI